MSAPIQTGKTTAINNWASNRNDVDGITQPIVDGKRHLLNIKSNELRLLELSDDTDNIIQVGKFFFSKPTFEWAKICLLHAMLEKPAWLVIDEIGKLELKDKGLEPAVNYIVNECKSKSEIKLLLVVRDYLLDEVLSRYQLIPSETKIVNSTNEL